jgi:hypothetical protein
MLKKMNLGIGAHIGANMWVWTIVSGLVLVATMVGRSMLGNGYHLGDILALAGCVFGTFIILISERSIIRAPEVDDEDAMAA